jgi:hypothetical protein
VKGKRKDTTLERTREGYGRRFKQCLQWKVDGTRLERRRKVENNTCKMETNILFCPKKSTNVLFLSEISSGWIR